MAITYSFVSSLMPDGSNVCEVNINGRTIATITLSNHHGINVLSRYTMAGTRTRDIGEGVKCTNIEFLIPIKGK